MAERTNELPPLPPGSVVPAEYDREQQQAEIKAHEQEFKKSGGLLSRDAIDPTSRFGQNAPAFSENSVAGKLLVGVSYTLNAELVLLAAILEKLTGGNPLGEEKEKDGDERDRTQAERDDARREAEREAARSDKSAFPPTGLTQGPSATGPLPGPARVTQSGPSSTPRVKT